MAFRNVVVIGASAGGVQALAQLAAGLPRDCKAAIFVVLHVAPELPSVMPQILSDAGPLPAVHATDGMAIEPGRIYIAPPDSHLLLEPGVMRLSRGPRENGARPAVDPLFRSAAHAYGSRVIGVVLTGALDDGAAGLSSIKQAGGLAIVQRPSDASFSGMPTHALEAVPVDYVLSLEAIAPRLAALTRTRAPALPRPASRTRKRLAAETKAALRGGRWDVHSGRPSPFSCPACGGVLYEMDERRGLLRFRCHVGHAYGVDSLRNQQELALESALWAALRALVEQGALSRTLAERARLRGQHRTAKRFDERAISAEQQAALVREALLREMPSPAVAALPAHRRRRKGTRG